MIVVERLRVELWQSDSLAAHDATIASPLARSRINAAIQDVAVVANDAERRKIQDLARKILSGFGGGIGTGKVAPTTKPNTV